MQHLAARQDAEDRNLTAEIATLLQDLNNVPRGAYWWDSIGLRRAQILSILVIFQATHTQTKGKQIRKAEFCTTHGRFSRRKTDEGRGIVDE